MNKFQSKEYTSTKNGSPQERRNGGRIRLDSGGGEEGRDYLPRVGSGGGGGGGVHEAGSEGVLEKAKIGMVAWNKQTTPERGSGTEMDALLCFTACLGCPYIGLRLQRSDR